MAKFIVEYQKEKVGSLTPELLDSHIEYLRYLSEAGVLKLCGLFKDGSGALLVFETATLGKQNLM